MWIYYYYPLKLNNVNYTVRKYITKSTILSVTYKGASRRKLNLVNIIADNLHNSSIIF